MRHVRKELCWQNIQRSLQKSLLFPVSSRTVQGASVYQSQSCAEKDPLHVRRDLTCCVLPAYSLTTRRPSLAGEAARLKDCEQHVLAAANRAGVGVGVGAAVGDVRCRTLPMRDQRRIRDRLWRATRGA